MIRHDSGHPSASIQRKSSWQNGIPERSSTPGSIPSCYHLEGLVVHLVAVLAPKTILAPKAILVPKVTLVAALEVMSEDESETRS